MNIEKYIMEEDKDKLNILGMLVTCNDETIMRSGYCQSRYPIYSVTKVVTSSAVGIAVGEGRFSIDESLYYYIKDRIPATVNQNKIELMKKLNVKRLMTMSVKGLPFRAAGSDWLESALMNLPDNIDQEEFHYSNIPAYLTAYALQCALSEHLIKFLMPRFFEPLGIMAPDYSNDPDGLFYGASGMKLSVEELARIGNLYLHNGFHKRCEIIPESWIRSATDRHINNREGGYGYFIWMYKSGYNFSGKWGQRCLILPKQKLIVTYLFDLKEGYNEE